MTLLRLSGVCAGFPAGRVLHDVSLAIGPSESVAVIGPNGHGKSTFLRCMAGLLRPQAGSIELGGKPIEAWAPRAFARVVALLPQCPPDPPDIAVRDYVGLGRFPHQGWLRRPTALDHAAIHESLRVCDALAFADRQIGALSGGERQRVRLAMALAQGPQVLLLDEPVSALDLRYQLEVLELLGRLRRSLGIAIVCVLHDIVLAARSCERAIMLRHGRVFADGPVGEILTEERIGRLFGVHARATRDGAGRLRALEYTLPAAAADLREASR